MSITFISFLILLFSCYSIFRRILRFIRKEQGQSFFKLFSTVIVWGGIAYVGFFPSQARQLSRQFGFGDNLNTLIFFGFVVVFIILFHLLSIVEKSEKLLTEIVRKEALNDFFKP